MKPENKSRTWKIVALAIVVTLVTVAGGGMASSAEYRTPDTSQLYLSDATLSSDEPSDISLPPSDPIASSAQLGKLQSSTAGLITEVEAERLPASAVPEQEYPNRIISGGVKEEIERRPSEVIELAPLDLTKVMEEDEATPGDTKRLRVSIDRPVPDFSPREWRFIGQTDSGYCWRIVIHSPQAAFICPQFYPLLDESIEIYLYGEAGMESLEGPLNTAKLSSTAYLGPIIEGEYLYIECISRSPDLPPELKLVKISHGYRNMLTGDLECGCDDIIGNLKVGSCHNDVTCYPNLLDKASGVARIYFEKGGSGYVCTGSLLVDLDTSTTRNWFLTAHHCISSDSVANTLKAYFNYRTSACNGSPPSLLDADKIEGSDYITGSSTSDFTLLELDDYPPAGTYYLGWSTGDIGDQAPVFTIHHPGGSYQRIAFGNEDGTWSFTDYWGVAYVSGATEHGSSGAPLFLDQSPYYIRGQLKGGNSSCDDVTGGDYFGKFGKSWTLGLSRYLSLTFLPDLYDEGEAWRSFSPQTMIAGVSGQPLQIHCDIRNGGDAGSGGFKVEFYASTNDIITTLDYYIGEKNMASIPAGDWDNCDWSGSFPTGIPAGTYWIGWIIDPDKEVCEKKENNNTACKVGYQLSVTPPPHIELTPAGYTFPDVQIGECSSAAHLFTLTNTGAGTATGSVSLTGINADQFEIRSGGGSFSLGAGATKTISVRFCPTSTGFKSASLFADGSNCNDYSSSLYGTGFRPPEIDLNFAMFSFPEVPVGQCAAHSFVLQNIGDRTATGTVFLTGSAVDQFEITSGGGSFSLAAGATKTVSVSFCPTSTGLKSAILFADGSNCNDDKCSLLGTGFQPPMIQLTPSSYDFGDVEVGQCSGTHSFTLQNLVGDTATGSVSLTGINADQFEITSGGGSFSLAAGARKTVSVRFCPTSTGFKTASLFADGSNCNDYSSPLYGTGFPPPQIELTPSSYAFEEVQVGQGSTHSFALQNVGGGIATGSVSLTGANADQFQISGGGSFSLGAGGTKTISVSFCPTSTGFKSASLFADGSNCNDDSSSVSGTGIPGPQIELTPSSYDFGTSEVDQWSGTHSFTLQNIGGGTAIGSVSLAGTNADQFQITSGRGGFSLGAGATRIISVRFRPTSTGFKSASLFADGSNCNDDSCSLSGTGWLLPGTPSLVSPPNGETVSTTLSLDWSDVSDAASYDVEVCSDSGCTSVVRSANAGSSQWTVSPALNEGVTYYWHARARNSCGPGSWSSIRSFTTSSIPPTPDLIPYPLAFNVKGSIHRVCINWDEDLLAQAQIDWWLEGGVNIDPSDVIVISPSGANPNGGVYGETIKTKNTIDNVDCIEIRSMHEGDVHIFVWITLGADSWTLHAEKKWGELHHTVLDVDATTTAVDRSYSVEFDRDETGEYRQFLGDTVYALFPAYGEELADGACVHWWLVEDTDANQAWVDAFMDYLAAHGGGLDDDHWAAHGTYTISDLGGREPWEYINDWVCGPDEIVNTGDDRAVDPNLFYWSNVYVPGEINTAPNTDDWYAWAESDNGVTYAALSVEVDGLTPDETYGVMTVVLVSYPSGSTPQDDPHNGENPVCLEKGKMGFHKAADHVVHLDADFEATPRDGDAPLTVTFDPTWTTGGTAPYTELRWDFGDGTPVETHEGSWTLATLPSTTHTYTEDGIYTVSLTVIDSTPAPIGPMVDICERIAYITVGGDGGNNPPNTPSGPLPSNHATGVSTNANLSWTGGDPDAADTVTYNVYFGTSPSPSLRATIGPYGATQSSITYDPGALVEGITYYWQLVATDNHGASTAGPVWDFTVGGVSPDEPSPAVAFASLIAEGKLIIAYNYDPWTTVPTTVAGWTWYDPALPLAQNNLANLSKNTAYWVKVTEECWLTYGNWNQPHLAAGWNNPVWLGS